MDDLISRQAAMDEFYKCPNIHWTTLDVLAKLNELPTAEPELANNSPKVENENGDLISRQAAIDAHCELCDMNDKCICIYCKDIERFMKLPTADLSEYCDKLWKAAYERGKAEAHPKKGKWIDYCGGVKCDQCGFECDDPYYLDEANYCPNCGTRMEAGDEHTD